MSGEAIRGAPLHLPMVQHKHHRLNLQGTAMDGTQCFVD